jgi:regulator of cell morphogenesis and NO signaling
MEKQLEQLIHSSKGHEDNLKLILTFFLKYKSELLLHIMDEEESVFPYVLRIDEALRKDLPVSDEDTMRSIEAYEKEHSDVDEKLNDLKNLVIKFLVSEYDDNLCNDFLITLFQVRARSY